MVCCDAIGGNGSKLGRMMSNGLSSVEAGSRLQQFGANRLAPATQRSVVLQFLAHFKNPLVLVLLVAAGVSALTGDVTGALIIGAIVLMSVTLDFVQRVEAQLAMRNYSGFLGGEGGEGPRIRGAYGG